MDKAKPYPSGSRALVSYRSRLHVLLCLAKRTVTCIKYENRCEQLLCRKIKNGIHLVYR